ncbi:hypothetical protein NIASO_06670 [Niabella soli DSM 19437]|uniref:Uncharacterized protein n=1 Tax=Niabella soli DSM 19437 TaxID=929713 RepID=W0F7Q7_9BACT|nr:hypothetical protein NIASO_06670 [Niabella soli DSM 19437]
MCKKCYILALLLLALFALITNELYEYASIINLILFYEKSKVA